RAWLAPLAAAAAAVVVWINVQPQREALPSQLAAAPPASTPTTAPEPVLRAQPQRDALQTAPKPRTDERRGAAPSRSLDAAAREQAAKVDSVAVAPPAAAVAGAAVAAPQPPAEPLPAPVGALSD